MDSIFFSFGGLPIHPLIVHIAVVILPLAAATLIASIYSTRVRERFALVTLWAIGVGTIATYIAKESGEALAEEFGNPEKHADYGSLLFSASLALLAFSINWYGSRKNPDKKIHKFLRHFAALIAVVVIVLTVLTGHSGAAAVWEARIAFITQ